jgi:uncharacterized protein
MQWFQKLMPREEKFFVMFARHAAVVKTGAGTLRELMNGGPGVPELCKRLSAEENQADDIAREVLDAIRKSFITPFDRTDIKDLITTMDDAIDQMHQTAKAVTLFEISEFDDTMREMSDIIVEGAGLVAEIVPLLGNLGTNAPRLNALTARVVELEEKSDKLHDAGLKALYTGKGRQDAMAFIIGSEIYSHLEKVADRLEDVASQVNAIVIEHL